MKIEIAEAPSPIGDIVVACLENAVVALRFADKDGEITGLLGRRFRGWEAASGPAADTIARGLRDYFAGDLRALDAMAVDTGGTPFQQAVWAQLRRIPPGRTASYREIADAIDAATDTALDKVEIPEEILAPPPDTEAEAPPFSELGAPPA